MKQWYRQDTMGLGDVEPLIVEDGSILRDTLEPKLKDGELHHNSADLCDYWWTEQDLPSFRVKISGEVFSKYNTEDIEALGRLVSILKKSGGWEWAEYNVKVLDRDEIIFAANNVQQEVVDIFTALQKGRPLEPVFQSISMKMLDEEL